MKYFFSSLALVLLTAFCNALGVGNSDMCPVKHFIEPLSPPDFAQRFQGDTIFFLVSDADNAFFESFRLLTPDTLWLKEPQINELPQEHEHFKLITHFRPHSGWGVNAYRQFTPGTVLEQTRFIIRGSLSETIQYLGSFNYVLLEDVDSGKIIKWDYTKKENKGLVIFSPSINRHLSLMKGLDFVISGTDSTFIPAKCIDVTFSINVNPKRWIINLDADFAADSVHISSHNWNPQYFLKKDGIRIINR